MIPEPGWRSVTAISSASSVNEASSLGEMAYPITRRREGIQDASQIDKTGPDTDIGDISQPYLVKTAHGHIFDKIGIPWKAMP